MDGRTLSADQRLEADICIIGAGPAGISLAISLAGDGTRIALVESGGLEPDPTTQSLYDGECTGLGYRIAESRLRHFGGSGNAWAGNCRPLDECTFRARSWIPHSGWPFAGGELTRYYEKARLLCGIPARQAQAADIRIANGAPVPWSTPIETAIWQISPITHFGDAFRPTLDDARGVTVLLNSNLLRLATKPEGNEIALAEFGTLAGTRFSIAARRYVLACGGVENARLLLAMASEQYPAGLGNRNDLVGRFFTEHPEIPIGALVYSRPVPAGVGHFVSAGGGRLGEGFRLTDDVQCSARICEAAFWPLSTGDVADSPPLEASFARQVQDLSSRLAGKNPAGPRIFTHLTLTLEQSPNPDSRVTLANHRDPLGMPRPRLDWQLNALDRRTFATAVKLMARECGRQRIGRLWLRPPLRGFDFDDPQTIRFDIPLASRSEAHNQLDTELRWGCHHMGTTRMHADRRQGVVDADCRVHGIHNLYVAGSSTFPTVGISNPTLTLIALALRLADHLAGNHPSSPN